MKELFTRIMVAIVAIPLIAALILFGKIPLVLFVNILLCLGLWEYYKLCGLRIRFFSQIQIMILAVIASWAVYYYGEQALFYSILLGFFLIGLSNIFRRDFALATTRMVNMFFGLFYLSLFNFMILIRELEHVKYDDYRLGGFWIWFMFAVIWICDTAAYLVGKPLGRIKFSPSVSPNKTVEGFIAGLVFGTLAAYVFSLIVFQDIPKIRIIISGFLISLIGQLADLIESLFKRRMGVKDSSTLIPGHGGVLDRFDSTLLAMPTLYFLLKYFIYID
jgi:phosphatidate cytidylyltransferase